MPLENGQKLHALCRRPFRPFWLDGYGHNDVPLGVVGEHTSNFANWLSSRRDGDGGAEAAGVTGEIRGGFPAHAVPAEHRVEGGAECVLC